MKKLILIAFILNSICSYAQKELYGTWIVSCPLEYIDKATSTYCGICPSEKKSESSIVIKNFELLVDENEMTFNINDIVYKVKYIWISETHSIEFTFKEHKYKFKTLYNCGKNNYILKDEDGQLLTLESKKQLLQEPEMCENINKKDIKKFAKRYHDQYKK